MKIMLCMLLLLCACASQTEEARPSPEKKAGSSASLSKVYVESVELASNAGADNELRFRVRGQLPNPAYTLDFIDVEINGNTIMLTPLAKHDASLIVTQMLVPFERVITVQRPKSGSVRCQLIGRGQNVEAQFSLQ